MSPPRSSSSSPPKQQHSGDGNKLVNRLGLGTLSLRPRWRVMVLGHQSVGKSGECRLHSAAVIRPCRKSLPPAHLIESGSPFPGTSNEADARDSLFQSNEERFP